MSQKFMLILFGGLYEGLSPDAMQRQTQKWFAWIEKLQKQRKYKSGEPLLPGGKILSNRNGRIVVDGPFAESKEAVAGYFVIDAANLEQAVDVSREYPDFDLGGRVEVREVMKIDMPNN